MKSPWIQVTHYLPVFTTVISAVFAYYILSRWRTKPEARHLLWWGIGVITYGVGTLLEASMTLFGWQVVLFKAWYIAGALLGGAPLAIGTLYLLVGRRAGHVAVAIVVTVVTITSVFVILSPVDHSLVDSRVPNSRVLEWQSIRMVSPFINSFAALFLIGGAFYSAFQYFRNAAMRNRFVGNLLIAGGAILPGVGGMMSRMGHTEALYVGEFIGIILIWLGYKMCQRRPAVSLRSSASLAVPSGLKNLQD